MKNLLASGDTVEVTAPGAVTAGQLVKVGSLVGVAKHAANSGAPVQLQRGGVFTLPKAAGIALAQGALALWNGTAIAGTGDPVGCVFTAASSGDTSVSVLLSGGVQELSGTERATLQAMVSGDGNAPATLDAGNAATYNGATVKLAAGATMTVHDGAWSLLGAELIIKVSQSGSATLAFSGTATKENASGTSASSVTLAASGVYALTRSPTGSPLFRLNGGASL